jgi:hypothetical protein
VSPTAIRHLVQRYSAEMTAPPFTAGPGDLMRIDHPDGRVRLRCPIWTEAGRSRLAMDVALRWPNPEPDDFDIAEVHIEQVVDTETGLVVLTEADAPAADGPFPNDPIVGTGEDPRIRSEASVDDSILVEHICGRIEQAVGHPLPCDAGLNSGQQAIYTLATGISNDLRYSLYTFIEDNPAWVHELMWAARHIGAHAHADYLDHAIDVVATHAWDDPQREAIGFDWVEDGQDIRDLVVAHIRANPDEFFR